MEIVCRRRRERRLFRGLRNVPALQRPHVMSVTHRRDAQRITTQPRRETGPMLERARFIEDYLSGFYSVTELASRYAVSRRTLHKWLGRHDVAGSNGLVDQSRALLRSTHRTSDDLAARIVAFRKRFPFMGPRKIIARLTELHPDVHWPAPSTAGDVLTRGDLVHPRKPEDREDDLGLVSIRSSVRCEARVHLWR